MKKRFAVVLLGIGIMTLIAGCKSSSDMSESIELKSELIKLAEYKGLSYEKVEMAVTDEEIEEEMMSEAYAYGSYEPIDKASVEYEDEVNISFVGTMDGVEFEGGSGEDYDLMIGSGEMIEGFEDGLVGAKPGDTVSLDLVFPEDYDEELAGKSVHFEVTINQIQQFVEPVLSDEFVIENMEEYENLEDFRNQTKQMLEEYSQSEAAESEEYEMLNQIITSSEFKMDKEELDQRALEIEAEYMSTAEMYGMDYEEFLELFIGVSADEFEEQKYTEASEGIQLLLVLSEIARKEKMSVTQKEYDAYVEEMMVNYEFASIDEVEETFPKSEIIQDMLYQRVCEFLRSNSTAIQ